MNDFLSGKAYFSRYLGDENLTVDYIDETSDQPNINKTASRVVKVVFKILRSLDIHQVSEDVSLSVRLHLDDCAQSFKIRCDTHNNPRVKAMVDDFRGFLHFIYREKSNLGSVQEPKSMSVVLEEESEYSHKPSFEPAVAGGWAFN